MTALKLILKIVIAPVILRLTLAIWICVGLVYVSFGLPKLAFWLLGKVQDLRYFLQDTIYG